MIGHAVGILLAAVIVLLLIYGSDASIDEMHRMEREHDEHE